MRLSHSWRTRFNTSGVKSVHASAMRSFRPSIFCIFIWYTMIFNCSHKQKYSGLKSGDLEGHSTDHGNLSNELEMPTEPTAHADTITRRWCLVILKVRREFPILFHHGWHDLSSSLSRYISAFRLVSMKTGATICLSHTPRHTIKFPAPSIFKSLIQCGLASLQYRSFYD